MTAMLISHLGDAFDQVQDGLLHGPITPKVAPEEVRRYLAERYDFNRPIALDEIIEDVEGMLQRWQVQVTHPRYFGLFNPSVHLASVVAETLIAMYNSQLASWRTSPAGNEIEKHTLGWLTEKFGLPVESLATFTSGGSEANHSAVSVGLTKTFREYGRFGIRAISGQPVIYVTAQAHHSYGKIAHMTGLGREAVHIVDTTDDLKMDIADLERQVTEDRKNGLIPFLVVGTAGTTAAGVIDPLEDISRFCGAQGLWFHADAAWGGAAIISPKLKRHLAGIENADSITCDAHKWFSVSMGCGMFFCRHPESVLETFRAETPYMPGKAAGMAVDPYTATMQWSRRFIGLKLFTVLANHGEARQAEIIEGQAEIGNFLRELLTRSGWRIVNSTPLPAVCFTREGLDQTKLVSSILERQIAWISETNLRGAPVLRMCITSFRTTRDDIHAVVDQLNELATEQGSVVAASVRN